MTGPGLIPLYTVPAGRTAIVKTLALLNLVPVVETFYLVINGQAIAGFDVAGDKSHIEREFFMVLNPGDVLTGETSLGGAWRCSGFGSLLLGAPS